MGFILIDIVKVRVYINKYICIFFVIKYVCGLLLSFNIGNC